VIVQDTFDDNGRQQCTDNGGKTPFWESPAILVSRTPIDPATFHGTTEFPLVGEVNYVYVKVRNSGPKATDVATLTVSASDLQLSDTFTNNTAWRTVGTESFALDIGEERWIGPFDWIPNVPNITLRAEISTAEDQTLKPDDVACDNNIAMLSEVPLVLDNPSYGPSLLAGLAPIHLSGNLTFRTLDLVLAMTRLSGESSFVAVDLDSQTQTNWTDNTGNVEGGKLLNSGRVVSNTNVEQMILEDLISGIGADSDLNILVVGDYTQGTGTVAIGLRAADRVVSGTTIVYTTDTSVLPTGEVGKSASPADTPKDTSLTRLIPQMVLIIAFVGLGLAWYIKRRERKQHINSIDTF
jgi:hypothetical protein